MKGLWVPAEFHHDARRRTNERRHQIVPVACHWWRKRRRRLRRSPHPGAHAEDAAWGSWAKHSAFAGDDGGAASSTNFYRPAVVAALYLTTPATGPACCSASGCFGVSAASTLRAPAQKLRSRANKDYVAGVVNNIALVSGTGVSGIRKPGPNPARTTPAAGFANQRGRAWA